MGGWAIWAGLSGVILVSAVSLWPAGRWVGGSGRSKTVSCPMAGKLWLALTAVASLQENERRQARALEAQAWNGHSITSTAFCGPEQIIRLALIQGIGKKTLPPGGRSRKVTLRRIGTFVAVFTNDLSHVPCL